MEATVLTWRTVAKIALVAILVYGVVSYAGHVASQLGDVITWLFLAVFLAIAFEPPVEFMVRHRISRSLAILAVYLAFLLAVFGVGLLVVPPIVNQVKQLAQDLPGYVENLSNRSSQFRKFDDKYHVTTKLKKQASQLPEQAGSAAGTLRDVTVGLFQRIVAALTIFVITFFLLRDGRFYGRKLLDQLPPERAEHVRRVAPQVHRAIVGYVGGNLLISAVAGLITWATLEILGVPFAAPLAVLMAFLDLIPLVGATLGGVLIGIVTIFVDFPTALIVWAVVMIVYQQIENHIVQPVIYRRAVKMHPVIVIVAILIGGTLLGVLGALLAIPVAAIVQILIKDWWLHRPQRAALHPEHPPVSS